jgi:hypothetical protein
MVKCSAKVNGNNNLNPEGVEMLVNKLTKKIVLQSDMQLPVPERVGWP